LGGSDTGSCSVPLFATFLRLDESEQPYNVLFVASAEEEISGTNGIASLIDDLPKVDFAIVGEPTQMHMAIAEKGLMVLDCYVYGKSGHAAREEGVNAIYEALPVLNWFKEYQFPKTSELLGKVKMSVTQVVSGSQHNVVPDKCSFVVDVRSNELYSNEELYHLISEHVSCEVVPRSFRINSSATPLDHPVVKKGLALKREIYGSPTTSDQALIPYLSVKIGPGDSSRSHTADEFVYESEIQEGIDIYYSLLNGLIICS
jgi:acetylornithine deacetylase